MSRLLAMVSLLGLAGCGARLDSRVKWTVRFEDVVAMPPTIGADGTIYAGSHDRSFSAVAGDGKRLWTVHADDFWHAPPAVLGDRLVVGAFDGRVYCLGLAGQELWRHQTDNRIVGGAAIGSDGTAYVPSDDGHLYALAPDGALRWTFNAGVGLQSGPVVLPDGGIVFGDSGPNGRLYKLSPAGRRLWVIPLGAPLFGSPAVDADGSVVVLTYAGRLLRVTPAGRASLLHDMKDRSVSSPVIDADGTIYAANQTGAMIALARDGTERWRFSAYEPIHSSPVLGEGGWLYFGADSQAVYCLDRATGKLRWKVAVGGYISSTPVLAPDGTLYVGCDDGKLYAIATDSRGLDPAAPWPHPRGGAAATGSRLPPDRAPAAPAPRAAPAGRSGPWR